MPMSANTDIRFGRMFRQSWLSFHFDTRFSSTRTSQKFRSDSSETSLHLLKSRSDSNDRDPR